MSRSKLFPLALVILMLLATGCAGSKGSVKPIDIQPTAQEKLAEFKYIALQSSTSDDLYIPPDAIKRIEDLVLRGVAKPDGPRVLSSAQDGQDNTQILKCKLVYTRYEEGNAFARAMLAGLGQMHITAKVMLMNFSEETELAKYEVDKTFAWGGIYGATQRLSDLEAGFAEAVADAVSGRQSNKAQAAQ